MDTTATLPEPMTHTPVFLCALAELRTFMKDFPDAPVTLHLRNFNDPARITLVALEVSGLPNDHCPGVTQCDLVALFPHLHDWLGGERGKFIPVAKFVENGHRMASLIGREVRIFHEWGSGPQTKSYGPFRP